MLCVSIYLSICQPQSVYISLCSVTLYFLIYVNLSMLFMSMYVYVFVRRLPICLSIYLPIFNLTINLSNCLTSVNLFVNLSAAKCLSFALLICMSSHLSSYILHIVHTDFSFICQSVNVLYVCRLHICLPIFNLSINLSNCLTLYLMSMRLIV